MKAQSLTPCLHYSNARTVSQLGVEISKAGTYYENLRAEYCSIVNTALSQSNDSTVKTVKLNSNNPDHMKWILEKCLIVDYTFFSPSDYQNGGRIGDKVVYRDYPGQQSDWICFEYKDVKVLLCKRSCGNPQLQKIIPKVTASKKDTVFIAYTVPVPYKVNDTIYKYLPPQNQNSAPTAYNGPIDNSMANRVNYSQPQQGSNLPWRNYPSYGGYQYPQPQVVYANPKPQVFVNVGIGVSYQSQPQVVRYNNPPLPHRGPDPRVKPTPVPTGGPVGAPPHVDKGPAGAPPHVGGKPVGVPTHQGPMARPNTGPSGVIQHQ